MKKYVCTICGYIYDEAAGNPSGGTAPGTRWEELPESWVCPLCGAPKSLFREQVPQEPVATHTEVQENRCAETPADKAEPTEDARQLNAGELSALCSNLARGCEKQYLTEESALFTELSDYFRAKAPVPEAVETEQLLSLIEKDLGSGYPDANSAAEDAADRGALRALVWGEKVTRILNSLLSRYKSEGDAFLSHTHVYVCTICGFIYIGEQPPELCPVCKVPAWKFEKIERRQAS